MIVKSKTLIREINVAGLHFEKICQNQRHRVVFQKTVCEFNDPSFFYYVLSKI